MAMSQPKPEGDGLRCLSFDGGGLRVICQAVIVREMLARLREDRQLAHPPKASDHFDMICGSGFGGLLAIMCGVLHMTGDELVEELVALCATVFIPNTDTAERTARLEEEIKRLVRKFSPDMEVGEERRMLCETATCKTFVCAAPSSDLSHPRLFRNYLSRSKAGPNCALWEAARAAMAVPGLFEPISIGSVHIRELFVAGDLRWSNPMDILTQEVKEVFKNRHVTCIVSIGSGHPGHLSLSEGLAGLFPRIARDCERLADDMARRFENAPDVYRRLSVDQGLQNLTVDLSNLHEAVSHTHSYLQGPQTSSHVDSLLVDLVQRPGRISAQEISGTILQPSPIIFRRTCPPPTEYFTGRESHLDTLHRYFGTETDSCHLGVLYGLGASGKTQIALKFIQQSQKQKRFTDVFVIDASDKITLENDLRSIAAEKSPKPTVEVALHLLRARDDEWLLFLDNADDNALDLYPYITWSHGNVLITTRNRDLRVHAPRCALQVDKLALKEAEELLLVGVNVIESAETKILVSKIVQELGCLALAINQARAYLAKDLCTLSEPTPKTDEYAYTVYTTWAISFDRLSPYASLLFQMLCFMHHEGISSDLFEYAWNELSGKEKDTIPPQLVEFLSFFMTADSAWSTLQFHKVIGEVLSFSLIEFDPSNRTISIHPLVQQWAQESFHTEDNIILSTQAILSLAVPLGSEIEHTLKRRSMVVHFREALKRGIQLHHTLLHPIVESYLESGVYEEALPLSQRDKDDKTQDLGDEHPDTLRSMRELVSLLWLSGNSIDARKLGEQTLDITKRIFGPEHPDTLLSMGTLASIHSHFGQYHDALKLEEHVLEMQKRLLGPENRETLVTMGNLADTYSNLGLHRDALKLGEQAVEGVQKIAGSEAVITLTYKGGLAKSYSSLGLHTHALNLREEVVKVCKRIFGAEHLHTLGGMQDLAESYSSLGRHAEALLLKTEISMCNLASTYSDLGRHNDALQLKEEVIELQKRILVPDHPNTLEAQAGLANTYSDLKRHPEALALKRHVLELREQKLGHEHPKTVTSMSDLAKTYSDLGQRRDALDLEEKVVELRSRLLGEEHPNTVKSLGAVEEYRMAVSKEAQNGRLIMLVGIALLIAAVAYLVQVY
ncbi:hypothetical protein DL96DRAFT_1819931 [Flagelloscypha sp. PMI_526]|nr:hypothetical protein DL96DRAFT_1819931 [Flagelloscypha sp. PMI_526]